LERKEVMRLNTKSMQSEEDAYEEKGGEEKPSEEDAGGDIYVMDTDEEIAHKQGAVIPGNRFMSFIRESKWKRYDGSGV
jgi:hypothetical protein